MFAQLHRLYSHPLFVPVVCLILAILLIVFAGPFIALAGYVPLADWVTRILLSAALVAGYALYKYIQHLKSLQQQDKLVAQITATDSNASQAIDAEASALREKFTAAFDALKQTKGGPLSLTKVPWYMIIGSPGTGKTTLLSNSGLSFPLADKLGNKALVGVGGTKNCEWWITKDAVLLDTAGRYASQDSYQKVDESGWKHFLALIKRFRKKPISGLLVSLSMTDISSLNEYELSQQVAQIKQRIAEVNDYFNTRFPVYLIITKADMLAGFSQFFETFSHKEREQAFGFTFAPSVSGSEDASQEFAQQFSALHQSLCRRQWHRLALERDSGRKSLLYGFGEQLASLQTPLKGIIRQLTSTEEGMSTGILRGLYFTSGTQSGAPIDRMQARISQVLGMQSSNRPLWNNDQRSYFIKDLLQQVVFAEADRFGTLAGYERRQKRVKQFALGFFTLLCVMTCAGLLTSFNNNLNYLAQADASVDSWLEQFTQTKRNDSLERQLPALNDFLTTINGLEDTQQRHFAGMGLNQSPALTSSLDASYQRLLTTVLLPFIQQQLENLLTPGHPPAQQYQALKTYLMLADNGKLRKNPYIKQFLTQNLNQDKHFSTAEYLQLQAHMQSLVDSGIRFTSVNAALIADARRILRAQPLGEIYYREFKNTLSSQSASYISMAQLAGSDWRNLFTTGLDEIQTIAGIFTPAQFGQIINQAIPDYLDDLADEAWVLGSENVIDQAATTKQLRNLYVQDYVDSWQKLLDSVAISATENAATLLTRLQALTQSTSPLIGLLNSVAKGTQLINVAPENRLDFTQQANEQLGSARQALGLDKEKIYVTSRFSKLHEVMATQQQAALEQQIRGLIQDIVVNLNFQLQNTQTTNTPISLNALQGFGFGQIAPLNRWTAELVSTINTAQHQLQKQQWNALWQNQVLPACTNIVKLKYPFQRASDVDASIADLVQLFAANGNLASFFNQHLASLVNTQVSPWQWQRNAQTDYQFSPLVLAFFESAQRIQQTLFGPNGSAPNTQLIVTPVYLDPRLARLRMSLYGTNIDYQFGRPTPTTITWPALSTQDSKINFIRRDGSEIITSKQGMFALSRLIDAGQIEPSSGAQLRVGFKQNDYKAIFEVSSATPNTPLIFKQLSAFQCLTSL